MLYERGGDGSSFLGEAYTPLHTMSYYYIIFNSDLFAIVARYLSSKIIFHPKISSIFFEQKISKMPFNFEFYVMILSITIMMN